MKKVLLVVLLMILVGLSGYFIANGIRFNQKNPPNKVDETSSWKTYTSKRMGFTFKYPSNLTVKEYSNPPYDAFAGYDALYVHIPSKVEYLGFQTRPNAYQPGNPVSLITFAGKQAALYKTDKYIPLEGGEELRGKPRTSYQVDLDGKTLNIEYFGDRDIELLFLQILSTFKFNQ